MTHPDLTTIPGSISYELTINSDKITNLFKDQSVSLAELKEFIKNLTMNITEKEKKSAGTNRFLIALEKQKTKLDVEFLVWNTMLGGANLKV